MNPIRYAFMGTPEFAQKSLAALCEADIRPVAVYTQPPRPSGRGQQLQKSPVQIYAESQGIPVLHPENLKSAETQAEFKNFNLDIAVVAAYGLLLPQAILDAPKMGCINIHGSLLPRWRGAAPIQRAIWAGDAETGIGLMQMEKGLDTGPVFIQKSIPIDSKMIFGELHERLTKLAAEMIVEYLPKIAAGQMKAQAQDESRANYAHKITKPETKIDWNKSAAEIERQIRALAPFPGAYFEYNGERIKIFSADIHHLRGDKPGTVISDDLNIATGEGILSPIILQRPGKQPMTKQEFLRGFKIPMHSVLL
ncbi:MAG: methionyl-tRNA formyltransferase [Alphaproteobacteria bacterium]|nr:MAG: methionyl-tRNA formyltransferase [Alphaproteobacteria bacterium]